MTANILIVTIICIGFGFIAGKHHATKGMFEDLKEALRDGKTIKEFLEDAEEM